MQRVARAVLPERPAARTRSAFPRLLSSCRVPILQYNLQEDWTMEINWRDDVDAALADAKRDGRPLLLDFSAAPM